MFEDIFKALFEALGNILPFLAILIVGIFCWITGSTGIFIGGGKIDEKVKKPLSFIGLILTIMGIFTTITSVAFLFWDFLTPYQSNLSYLWKQFSNLFSLVNLIIVGVSVLLLYIAKRANQTQIEKGYKLKVVPVVIHDYILALQVENIGKGSFSCIAKLVEISTLKGESDLDIDSVNPEGLFLQWDDERNMAVLQENVPRTINLVKKLDNYRPPVVKFMFSGRSYSNSLEQGRYLIKIALYRIHNKKQIRMENFEGTLLITGRHEPKISWEKVRKS